MKAITLRNRIIILLTIFTIVTIGVFVAIQLGHELKMATQYSVYKANIVSLVIEEKLSRVLGLTLPQDEKIGVFDKLLNSFKESLLIDKAYILNNEGKIVSSTEKWLLGERGDSIDFHMLDRLDKGESITRETIIDKISKSFSLYLSLKDESGAYFAARIFFSLDDIWQALHQVYQPIITLGAAFILINIILGILLSGLIINPIRLFNEAAKTIASGRLDSRVSIQTGDELEELGHTFNYMTKELVIMKEKAESANPLTKLPGNILIMDAVELKIEEGKMFTVIYVDLDNFKAFNDKYGIHKGDEAIKLAAQVFKEAIKKKGGSSDFVGHEGGDDFILLTTPEHAKGIADYIISEFDKRIRTLYDEKDLDKGYIVAHARDGAVEKFPIMSVSLAGVTNRHRDISSYAEVTNIAAELKKTAKVQVGSAFVLDMRKE